jgi:hypothetical protein
MSETLPGHRREVRRGLRLTPARFQSTEDAQPPRRPRIDESLPIVAEGRLSAERQRDIKRAADLETVEADGATPMISTVWNRV